MANHEYTYMRFLSVHIARDVKMSTHLRIFPRLIVTFGNMVLRQCSNRHNSATRFRDVVQCQGIWVPTCGRGSKVHPCDGLRGAQGELGEVVVRQGFTPSLTAVQGGEQDVGVKPS